MKSVLLLPLRVVVFLVGWFFYRMETLADWIVGVPRKTEYVRVGKCNRCGTCCQCVGLELPRSFVGRRWLVRAFGIWHRAGLNFQPIGEQGRFLLYRCGYYKDGRCSIYRFRHRICRFFPTPKLYGYPLLYEECGFSFVRRDVLNAEKKIKKGGKATFKETIDRLSRQ